MGDLGSIPGLGQTPGEGKGYPLQYSGLENSMDYTVHGVAKSWTRLSEFHFTIHHLLSRHEFEQTPGNLACCSPWGHKRVGHDLVNEQQMLILEFCNKDET